MKPTSLIFLALSLILLVGGFMVCGVAKSMAKNQGIRIYDQEINKDGDSVYTYNIADDTVTKLALKFSGIDVHIRGSESESYIELKNFDANSYSTTLTGSTVTVDGTVGFMSSLIDMSGGGIRFKGLRYFLMEKPSGDRQKSITVCISRNSGLKSLNVTSEKGDVYLSDIAGGIEYSISTTDSDIFLDGIRTTDIENVNSFATLTAVRGSITVKSSSMQLIKMTAEEGNITVDASTGTVSSDFITYDIKATEGAINYNGTDYEGELKITSPDEKSKIKAEITKGVVRITDAPSGGTDPRSGDETAPGN